MCSKVPEMFVALPGIPACWGDNELSQATPLLSQYLIQVAADGGLKQKLSNMAVNVALDTPLLRCCAQKLSECIKS